MYTAFAYFLLNTLPFDDKGLTDVREVKIVVQCGDWPDPSGPDAPIRNGGAFNDVRFLSILEMEDDVLRQVGLVSFDGEVVLHLPVLNQKGGERALS